MADLKPCPECGGKAGVYKRYDVPPLWSVACTKCGLEQAFPFGSYEFAVKQWNIRSFRGLWKKRPPESPGDHMVLDDN